MDTNTITPPLPPGFQLETNGAAKATSEIPPLPNGFNLEKSLPQSGSVNLINGTGTWQIPQLSEAHPGLMDKVLDVISRTLNPSAHAGVPSQDINIAGGSFANMLAAPSAVQQMKPGIGKALGEQLTLPNIAMLGAGGPLIGELAKSTLGKVLMSAILAKLAQSGAEQAGTEFGKASAEPAGGERRYDVTQGILDTAQALPATGVPLYREALPASGLNFNDIHANEAKGEPKQGGQVSFESQAGSKSIPSARQSGIENILPAVKTGKGLLVAKEGQITHADVLKANGIKPNSIPHPDARRGFVDAKTGQWFNRKEAERVTGIKGTAPAGGLDSTDLPRAKVKSGGFERKVYSPQDLAEYQRLNALMKPSSAEQFASPEYQKVWKDFEQLRNKYGGMPPKQLELEQAQGQEIQKQQPTKESEQLNENQTKQEVPQSESIDASRPVGEHAQPSNAPQQESVPSGAQGEHESSGKGSDASAGIGNERRVLSEGSEVKSIIDGPDKAYSGLDPEMFDKVVERFTDWLNSDKKDKPSERPLGWNPTWALTKPEREKQILENADAVKLEDSPQFRAQPGEKGSVVQAVNNKVTAAVNVLKKADKVVLPRDVILDMVDGGKGTYDGPVSRLFGWTIDDAYNREEILNGRVVEKLKPLQKGFTKQNRDRVGVYAIAQQKGGVQRLLDSGVKQGTIDHILKSFTGKEKAWYDQYRKISEGMFPYVRDLAKELYGVNLRYVENHFPFMRDYQLVSPELPKMVEPSETSTPEDIVSMRELMADYAVAEKGTKAQQGFLITRQPNAKTAIKYDAIEVANRFLRDVAHFITTQKLLKENGEIARSPKFREKYGQYGQQLIIDWMNTVARQGRFKRQSQILQWLRRKSSVGILAFRVASNLVHTANIPMAVERTGGIGHWRRGLDAALSDEGQAFLNKHFKETFARGGGEPALVEAQRGPVTKAGFAVERVIDRLNAQATSLGVYMKLLEEKGLNPEEYTSIPVDKDAIAQARVLARRAVASPLYKDTPAVLARGSDWTKLFFQFQNTFLDQWSNIRYDLAETRIGEFAKAAADGKINRATAGKIASLAAAVTAMIFWETSVRYEVKEGEQRATGHGGQESGDFWKRLGEDALKRVPGVGQTLAVAQYGESGFPLVDTIRDTAKAGEVALSAEGSGEPHKERLAAVKAATGAAEILGVPGASQVSEVLQDYMTSSKGLADRSQMYQAARKWMRENGVRVEPAGLESQYLDLNDALRKGDMDSAKAAYDNLKGKVKGDNIKRYYEEFPNRGFTYNKENEEKFYSSLNPEQREVYDRAKQSNQEVQARFYQMIGESAPKREGKKEGRSVKVRKKLNLFK